MSINIGLNQRQISAVGGRKTHTGASSVAEQRSDRHGRRGARHQNRGLARFATIRAMTWQGCRREKVLLNDIDIITSCVREDPCPPLAEPNDFEEKLNDNFLEDHVFLVRTDAVNEGFIDPGAAFTLDARSPMLAAVSPGERLGLSGERDALGDMCPVATA